MIVKRNGPPQYSIIRGYNLQVPLDALIGVKSDAPRIVRDGPRRHWKDDAKCATLDPELYETEHLPEGREDEAARELCEGCPVLRQCAIDALKPVDMARVLGTAEEPDFLYKPGDVTPEGDVFELGVVRAGIRV